jgi:hypothetical protein
MKLPSSFLKSVMSRPTFAVATTSPSESNMLMLSQAIQRRSPSGPSSGLSK